MVLGMMDIYGDLDDLAELDLVKKTTLEFVRRTLIELFLVQPGDIAQVNSEDGRSTAVMVSKVLAFTLSAVTVGHTLELRGDWNRAGLDWPWATVN